MRRAASLLMIYTELSGLSKLSHPTLNINLSLCNFNPLISIKFLLNFFLPVLNNCILIEILNHYQWLRWGLSRRNPCRAWASIYTGCFRCCFWCFVHGPDHPAGRQEEEERQRTTRRRRRLSGSRRHISRLLRLSLF